MGYSDCLLPLGKMLELAKLSWEGVILGGSWVCHVACINQINHNN